MTLGQGLEYMVSSYEFNKGAIIWIVEKETGEEISSFRFLPPVVGLPNNPPSVIHPFYLSLLSFRSQTQGRSNTSW